MLFNEDQLAIRDLARRFARERLRSAISGAGQDPA